MDIFYFNSLYVQTMSHSLKFRYVSPIKSASPPNAGGNKDMAVFYSDLPQHSFMPFSQRTVRESRVCRSSKSFFGKEARSSSRCQR